MAKNREIADLPCAAPACPTPVLAPDCRPRRLRQDSDARSVALRAQVAQSRPESEMPLGDVMAPPACEPVIESAASQPQVSIGQADRSAVDKVAPSLLQRFMAVLSIGGDEAQAPDAEDERIIGSGDRAHHLALIAGTPVPVLRPARAQRAPLITRLAPKSRADCQRRCGKDGFCDPSSELGCGGVHCGNPFIREPL